MSIGIVFLMFAIWSSIFPLAKLTLLHTTPLFLTSVRMLLAGAILLGFLAIRRRSEFQSLRKNIFSLSLYALFCMYLTNAFEFWSVQHLSASKACFLYSLSPFLTAFFSYLHFGEKMNRRKWIGLIVGFIGITPVFAMQTGSESFIGGLLCFSWPELGMLAATFCSVYGWVILRLLVKDSSISPTLANGAGMWIGGLFALVHSLISDSWSPIPVTAGHELPFIQGIFLMTLISNILCYNLYGYLLRTYTATFMSFVGLLSPLFASFSSWIILGEVPSLTIFLSTSVVGIGLWLVYSAELKMGYIQNKAPLTTSS